MVASAFSPCWQGSLAQLDTKTPVMYVDFPAGRLKLFGTLCFPKAKYLALRFGPKEVLCEDVFENMVRTVTDAADPEWLRLAVAVALVACYCRE